LLSIRITAERTSDLLVSVGPAPEVATRAGSPTPPLQADGIEAALAGYAALDGIDEVAVLSTPSGVEVFAWTSCPAAGALAIRHALETRAGRELSLVERQGDAALRQLARLAAGADAAVAGEPQILTRVKGAFERAARSGAAGSELSAILGRALAIVDRVRCETALGDPCLTWACAAADLAEKVLGPLARRRVAVIGASEAASLAARQLRLQGAALVFLAAERDAGASALAAELGAGTWPAEALEEELLRCDVVLCAAASAPAPLRPEPMARAAAARRRRLMVLDLAVPPAIPAATGRVRDVYLFDTGDLGRVVRAAAGERAAALEHAERVIGEEVARWSHGGAGGSAGTPIAVRGTRRSNVA
jgi:glutamyl-tRNA reductase